MWGVHGGGNEKERLVGWRVIAIFTVWERKCSMIRNVRIGTQFARAVAFPGNIDYNTENACGCSRWILMRSLVDMVVVRIVKAFYSCFRMFSLVPSDY